MCISYVYIVYIQEEYFWNLVKKIQSTNNLIAIEKLYVVEINTTKTINRIYVDYTS